MSDIALGLMSGTSADGVSAAMARFDDHSFEFMGSTHHAYSTDILKKIRSGPELPTQELSRLNIELGEIFAQTALRLFKRKHVNSADVFCIGSHGQTIYHGPTDGPANTLQIAEPLVIAERTKIDTISHFRQRDMAVGGLGAPLIPFFDDYFFGKGPVRAFQNIGGISNVTVVGSSVKEPVAFDTGPGNSLMDRAISIIEKGKVHYDVHGQRAKKGQILMDKLNMMMKHPYITAPPPKSTGPELFGDQFLNKTMGRLIKTRPNDVVATLNQFTCLSIQENYRRFVFPNYPVQEVVVSGGGVYNKTLMKKLECLFAPIPVRSIEELGIPSQDKEPLAFAFLALRRKRGLINHLPQCTGAKKTLSLGIISPGS